MSLPILESVNLTGTFDTHCKERKMDSQLSLKLDPLNFKIGFYQINFLCHLFVRIYFVIEKKIENINKQKKQRIVKQEEQNQQKTDVVKQPLEFDSVVTTISFDCDSILIQVIDDTKNIHKNLVEFSLRRMQAHAEFVEEKKDIIKEFLINLGVTRHVEKQFMLMKSSFEMDLKYLNV